MVTGDNPFSAADSALGYFFQCRYALLESLRRYRESADYEVSIETLDDVVFETDQQSIGVYQLKHHLKHTGSLSEGSPDLWKTLRIWCEGVNSKHISQDAIFFLVTTATASPDSAASRLREAAREPDAAFERLRQTASTSTNKGNKPAYDVFLKSPETARFVLASTTVLDATAAITDVPDLLRREVRAAVISKHLDFFIERLEGWWYKRVIQQLTGKIQGPIQSEELEDQIDHLRDGFSDTNLPIDDSIRDADIDQGINASLFLDENFVHQLQLIQVTNPRIFIAIREYFRAFEQRSQWMREELVYVATLVFSHCGRMGLTLPTLFPICFQLASECIPVPD
jgi:hypothetical protein